MHNPSGRQSPLHGDARLRVGPVPSVPLREETGTIPAGPFNLAYRVEGVGQPVLVVGSALYYARVLSPALRACVRLAFVDHRGFGRPHAPYGPADYTLDAVLDDVEAPRQRLGLGRVVVLGHSGHGLLALEYAKRYPEGVSHVVVVAAGPGHAPEHAAAAEPGRRFVAFCLAMAARSWADPAFDAAPLWHGVRPNMDVVDHLWGEALRDLDVGAGLAELAAPVLLAAGRLDYLVAPVSAWGPYRAAFRDLTVRVFEGSGHTPPFEEPEAFAAELVGWLAARPSTTP